MSWVSDVKFEIGHVLFIDIVGYSQLLINEQSAQLETLKKSSAVASRFAPRKLEENYCACRPVMVAR